MSDTQMEAPSVTFTAKVNWYSYTQLRSDGTATGCSFSAKGKCKADASKPASDAYHNVFHIHEQDLTIHLMEGDTVEITIRRVGSAEGVSCNTKEQETFRKSQGM